MRHIDRRPAVGQGPQDLRSEWQRLPSLGIHGESGALREHPAGLEVARWDDPDSGSWRNKEQRASSRRPLRAEHQEG